VAFGIGGISRGPISSSPINAGPWASSGPSTTNVTGHINAAFGLASPVSSSSPVHNVTGNIPVTYAPSSPAKINLKAGVGSSATFVPAAAHNLNLKAGVGSSVSIVPASPHSISLKAGVGSAVTFTPASPHSFSGSSGTTTNETGNVVATIAPTSPHKLTLKGGVGSSVAIALAAPHALSLKGGVGSSASIAPASPHKLSLKAGVGSPIAFSLASPTSFSPGSSVHNITGNIPVTYAPSSPAKINLKAGVGSAVAFVPASPHSFGGAVTTNITGNVRAAIALASPVSFAGATSQIITGNVPVSFGLAALYSLGFTATNISADVVNEALQLIGDDGQPVTGIAPSFDSSAAGKAAAKVYTSTVTAVARQFSWDFARQNVLLQLSGNSPPYLWAYEYVYPASCIQLWQVSPAALSDPNNPQPVGWAIGNSLINGVQTKVIWTNQQNARAVFNSNPPELTWDPLFRQTVVRMLAAKLATALSGKPDTSQSMFDTAGAFQSIGEARDS
jgi:hypothetical protein